MSISSLDHNFVVKNKEDVERLIDAFSKPAESVEPTRSISGKQAILQLMKKWRNSQNNGVQEGGLMLYPICTLEDDTEITASKTDKNGNTKLYIEKFDSEKDEFLNATILLPMNTIESSSGFSKEDINEIVNKFNYKTRDIFESIIDKDDDNYNKIYNSSYALGYVVGYYSVVNEHIDRVAKYLMSKDPSLTREDAIKKARSILECYYDD